MPTPPPGLTAAFAQAFDHAPVGVWAAPGRVNIIGEHTDYNGGHVLPCAIDSYAFAAVAPNPHGLLRVSSTFAPGVHQVPLARLDEATFTDWTGYALGVPWAMARRGVDLGGATGVDILIDSQVPVGAGLSSSAAIESVVAVALTELWGLSLSRMELAAVGQYAENHAVGAPTGIMDQAASLLGEADHAVLLDCHSLEARTVPLGLREAGLELLVMDSHVSHAHADGGYASRREACERGARLLGVDSLRSVTSALLEERRDTLDPETYRRVRHVITEDARVLEAVHVLETDGPLALGPLLAASHASMRDDFEISVPEIDLMVDTAVGAGAVGARLTGGGFGGSAIALVPFRESARVVAEVTSACADAGFAVPSVRPVTPASGAARVASPQEGL